MKRCPDCDERKPLEDFPRNKNYKDGRHPCCNPCHNAPCRQTRDRLYGGSRHYHLKRRYGIGAAEVDDLIERQAGRCPIWGRENPEHVDHDHETGRVRGVLCFNCNGGLGQFADDIDRLIGAIAYLDRARADDTDAARARGRVVALIGAGADGGGAQRAK